MHSCSVCRGGGTVSGFTLFVVPLWWLALWWHFTVAALYSGFQSVGVTRTVSHCVSDRGRNCGVFWGYTLLGLTVTVALLWLRSLPGIVSLCPQCGFALWPVLLAVAKVFHTVAVLTLEHAMHSESHGGRYYSADTVVARRQCCARRVRHPVVLLRTVAYCGCGATVLGCDCWVQCVVSQQRKTSHGRCDLAETRLPGPAE